MTGTRTLFVGIGAGAIQLGMWGYFAHLKRARIVLAEVDRERVAGIRRNGGRYTVNIARGRKVKAVTVGPVEILDPNAPADRVKLLAALARADDIVTAVPSTKLYRRGGVAALLRAGLKGRRGPVLIYASENQIGAGRMLEKMVFPGRTPRNAQFLETVIERMGGPQRAGRFGLKPIAPGLKQALLVEDFCKIVVSKPRLRGHRTVFGMFRQVPDVFPYEELKLYGHNAVHFLLGVLGRHKGYRYMSQFRRDPDFRRIGVAALLEETGGWFRKKYARRGVREAGVAGYKAWARQLMRRIVNPLLRDPVARVIREPERKLAWEDRIVGTMRRALLAGITPKRYALGVAGALLLSDPARPDPVRLARIWGRRAGADEIRRLAEKALGPVRAWRRRRKGSLADFADKRGYFG